MVQHWSYLPWLGEHQIWYPFVKKYPMGYHHYPSQSQTWLIRDSNSGHVAWQAYMLITMLTGHLTFSILSSIQAENSCNFFSNSIKYCMLYDFNYVSMLSAIQIYKEIFIRSCMLLRSVLVLWYSNARWN